ncbi:MAG: hypothetical protein H6749_04210 [Nitrospiraceae bacterium]|nr:hypothetical protein [Nitrospiraceae bacterium]
MYGVASPVAGWLYTDAKFGDEAENGVGATKTGKACATSILTMFATGMLLWKRLRRMEELLRLQL